jgi:hypothetical protein
VIRLAALFCGALCGIGLALSGLFEPTVLQAFLGAGQAWSPAFGVVALSALVVGGALILAARAVLGGGRGSMLGGEVETVAGAPSWRAVTGGALFGAGLGLAGYAPLTALVALGLFAPGAAIFLSSVLGGMILHDLVANRSRLQRIIG